MNALVPMNPCGGAVALPGAIAFDGNFKNLPASIQKAIVQLDLAYTTAATQNFTQNEWTWRNEVMATAIDGFPIGVVSAALKDLMLHNPNGQFPITPQDIRLRCEAMLKVWEDDCFNHFGIGRSDIDRLEGLRVENTPDPDLRKERRMILALRGRCRRRQRPEHVPSELQVMWLRPWIAQVIEQSEKGEIPLEHGFSNRGWWLAKTIRNADDLPPQLIKEFGVLTGEAFRKLDARIIAEREEAERNAREYEEANAEALAKEREEAAAAKRAKEAERERRWQLHIERSYPLVNGRRTLGKLERKDYRDYGYSDDMIDAAVADLYETPGVLLGPANREISAEDFRDALGKGRFMKFLEAQRRADPDNFMPVH